MALSAASVWECRTTGLDTNSAGFVTGASGTDYSQQASPQYSVTDGVTAGTTTITSATASFGTDVVGNLIYVTGGTGTLTAVWRQITARTNATTITVDASTGLGASTGVTLHIGGCMLSPAMVIASAVSNNTLWIKAGTYTISTASTNIAAGCLSGTVANMRIEGYQTTRADLGTPPLLQASGISTASLVAWSNNQDTTIRNINVDGAGLTAIKGWALNRGTFYKLAALNCTNNGFNGGSNAAIFVFCRATGCSTQAAFSAFGQAIYCEAYSNTIGGFNTVNAGGGCYGCLSHDNSGAASDGFTDTSSGSTLANCSAYNNGRDGFRTSGNSLTFINCVAETNVGNGFSATAITSFLFSCAAFGNGTNFNLAAGNVSLNPITGTASFFNNAAAGDFSLNNAAGGGALLRAAGMVGVFPAGLTTSYQSIGAAEIQSNILLNPSLEGL
jgi:hypothetical protein